MPISVKKLESEGKEVTKVKNRPAQDLVRKFLEDNAEHAFMQSEIGAELGMRPQQVRQCCLALEKQGVAVRKAVAVSTSNGSADRIFYSFKQ